MQKWGVGLNLNLYRRLCAYFVSEMHKDSDKLKQ